MWLQYFKNLTKVILFTCILFHKILAQDDLLQDDNVFKNNNEFITARAAHPDLYLTTPEMIERQNYTVETHSINSTGYILNIYRMPNVNKPPVFLNHGFLGSSDVFVISGPGKSLAYTLFDAGFDVWIGNRRGNTYSKNHSSLDNYYIDYWQFGIQETATIDLPTIIDHILQNTSNTQLDYIGYSIGVMEVFILMDEKPEYNAKIRQLHGMSPYSYMGTSNPLASTLKTYITVSTWAMTLFNIGVFEPNIQLLEHQATDCDGSTTNGLCMNAFNLLFTINSTHIDQALIPVIVTHIPAGSSVRTASHIGSLLGTETFVKYDFGASDNLINYGQPTPPAYDLSKTTLPVYLYYAQDGDLATVHDVERLCTELPNCIEKNLVAASDYVSADFVFASDAKSLVYDRMVTILKT